ncbi:MAG: hypothetical protein ABR507_02475 [Actinomycetota bacterium]
MTPSRRTNGSVSLEAQIEHEFAGQFETSGGGQSLFPIVIARQVVGYCRVIGAGILGLEGFARRGEFLIPRMDRMAAFDVGSQFDEEKGFLDVYPNRDEFVRSTCLDAARLIDEWQEDAELLIEFSFA